jgi:hypothetical protein
MRLLLTGPVERVAQLFSHKRHRAEGALTGQLGG